MKPRLLFLLSPFTPSSPARPAKSQQGWWSAKEMNKRHLRKMEAIKQDERPPAGKKLVLSGESWSDKNKSVWRSRSLFYLSHCRKQNSQRSPVVVKLLFCFGFFFLSSGCTEIISSREAVSWHFDFNATAMIRTRKQKLCWKVSPCQLFFMQNCSFCVASNLPVLAAARRDSAGHSPSPSSWQMCVEQWDCDRTRSDEMIPRVVSLLCSLSFHFVSCLFFFKHRRNTGKKRKKKLFLSPCAFVFVFSYFVSFRIQLKQWVCISGSLMVSLLLFFFLLLRAGKL